MKPKLARLSKIVVLSVFSSSVLTPLVAYADPALTISALVEQVKQNNPLLAQNRHLHEAAIAAIPQVTAWSNPQVGLSQSPVPGNPLHLNASQGFSYSLTQPFQLFGKKRLAGEIAQDQADVAGTQVIATEQQLLANAKATFYQLLAYRQQEKISQENIQRLDQIKRISKIRYANNAAAYVDYLNAQVAQSSAENDLFALQRQIETTRQTLNTLLGREPQMPLELAGDIPGVRSAKIGLEELASLTLKHNPNLRGSALQVAAAEKSLEYARKAYLPDFQVIVTRISDNPPWGLAGKNYGMELDLVLPTWFLEKERAGEDQAKANLLANRSSEIAARQQTLLAVAASHNTWLQSQKQFEFIRDRQLPEAQVAWRLTIQNYATNNSQAFTDLLVAQSNLRTTELALLQAETTAAQSWVALEAAVGIEIDLQ